MCRSGEPVFALQTTWLNFGEIHLSGEAAGSPIDRGLSHCHIVVTILFHYNEDPSSHFSRKLKRRDAIALLCGRKSNLRLHPHTFTSKPNGELLSVSPMP